MAAALSSSFGGASVLILIQLCSRASTFIVNQALLRYLTPELLGVSLRLELLSITILYFSRESLRVALQRQAANAQTVVNLGYLAVALGIPLSIALCWQYARSAPSDIVFMQEAVALTGFATVIELFSEPPFAVVQQKFAYGIRATAETSATIVRCLVTFATVVWYDLQNTASGALPFAYGHLSYALVLTILYYARTASIAKIEAFSILPKALSSSDQSEYMLSYFSRPLCALAVNLYVQSGIKYFLTQGDSLLIATFTTLQDQGVYGLASNYGGLIARIVFQPIEESSRNSFAKLCPADEDIAIPSKAPNSNGTPSTSTTSKSKGTQETASTKDTQAALNQGRHLLTSILHLYTILAIIAFSLSPPIAPILLKLLIGRQWQSTDAGTVLAAYTYYIPFLAINGVTEAFVAAVANSTQLRMQSIAMACYFFAFGVAVYGFLRVAELGAVGLVYANCVNMMLRIVWNARFIGQYFGRRETHIDVSGILPSPFSIAAAAIVAASVRRENPAGTPTSIAAVDALIWPAINAAALGLAILFFERKFFQQLYSSMGRRR